MLKGSFFLVTRKDKDSFFLQFFLAGFFGQVFFTGHFFVVFCRLGKPHDLTVRCALHPVIVTPLSFLVL
jgi:lipid-A-disaccharide synthase-like uncharacterized protein